MEFITTTLLDPLCERLISATIQEYNLLRNVSEDIGKLSFRVSLIRRVLRDAEEKQVKEEAIRIWLRSLKQVLFDAEDVLDEAATDDILQTRDINDSESVIVKKAKVIFCTTSRIPRRLDIAHQINTIILTLDDLYKEKDGLGLRVLDGNNWPLEVRRRVRPDTSSMLADESKIIGRDAEKKKIIQLLSVSRQGGEPMNSSNNVDVLAIVGMGGVGKTTLAQLVFNDQTVQQHFQLKMWVCVSEDFDLNRMYKELMDAAVPQNEKQKNFEIINWDSAQKRLKHMVEEKMFLLVLDDVWEEDPSKWERFYEPLKYGGKGSKIIITTRIKQVSDMTKAFPITLNSLASEGLWPIFKRYAFDGYSSNETMHLEAVGRNINDKLKGSPLAAKIIGRFLNSNLDMKFWKNVMQNESLLQESDILPILKLSYDQLPGYLKQCFAYCSLFPKDHKFDKGELVQLWMAQNFIQTARGPHAKSIGCDQYFNDLHYRSFFEQHKWRGIVMHDFVHDLAELVSKDECFKLGNDNSDKEISETVRHVSLFTDKFDLARLRELCEHGKLRTLLFMCKSGVDLTPHLDNIFVRLKRLRVLRLRGCIITELPASIGNLKHLRFLDLSKTLINKLPESLCNLHNLQVLNLDRCSRLHALPDNMSALINLRHLVAHEELVSNIEGWKLTLEKVSIWGDSLALLFTEHSHI